MTITLPSVEEWNRKTADFKGTTDITARLTEMYRTTTIYQQFDALCALMLACEHYPDDKNTVVNELREDVTAFTMAIVDAVDKQILQEKIKRRQDLRGIDPEYMPWNIPSSRTPVEYKSTRKNYLKKAIRQVGKNSLQQQYCYVNSEDVTFDQKHHVQYLEEEKTREHYRIFPSGNKIKKITTNATGGLVLSHFDTLTYNAHKNLDRAIFVISPKGDIFAGSTIDGEFHHSSFLAGGATFYAGTLQVTNGVLKHLDDQSGHYAPVIEQNIHTLTFFRKCGLLTKELTFSMYGRNKQVKETLHPLDKYRFKKYRSLLQELEAVCDNEKYRSELRSAGKKIILEIKKLHHTVPTFQLKNILRQTKKVVIGPSLWADNPSKNYTNAIEKLVTTAKKLQSKSNKQKITTALLLLAGIAFIIAGITFAIPSGGTSLLGTLIGVKSLALASTALGITIGTATATAATVASGYNLFKFFNPPAKQLTQAMLELETVAHKM